MYVTKLDLVNFRNYQELHIEFPKGLNLIVGPNASGKTNLIEALYYLSLARSFKKAEDKDLIRFNEEIAEIQLAYQNKENKHLITAKLSSKGKLITFDNEKLKSVSSLIGKLLAISYYPNSVNLFRLDPMTRRNFLDSSISLISSKYLFSLGNFKKILKKRNAAFIQGDEVVIKALTDQLINSAYRLTYERKKFVTELNLKVNTIYQELFNTKEKLTLKYQTKMPLEEDQLEFIKKTNLLFDYIKSEERIKKSTLIGPQRDDLVAYLDGKQVYSYASQGQNRLVVLALHLAFKEILKEHYQEEPILLLDDVLSDLDLDRQERLLNYLKKQEQVFITTTKEYSNVDNIIKVTELSKGAY